LVDLTDTALRTLAGTQVSNARSRKAGCGGPKAGRSTASTGLAESCPGDWMPQGTMRRSLEAVIGPLRWS